MSLASRTILSLLGLFGGGAIAVLAIANNAPRLAIAAWAGSTISAAAGIVSLAGRERMLSERARQDDARLRQSLALPAVPPESSVSDAAVDAAVDAVRAGRESERQLRAIVGGIDDCLLATDQRGYIVLANAAAAQAFGRSGPMAGRAIEDVLAQVEVLEMHRAALAGQQRRGQIRLPRAGQNRHWQVSAMPVPLLDGPGAVLTLRDVTDLATAVQLKTDFVANASHELRTPLSSIKAAVETLSEGAKEEPAMRDRLLTMIGGNVTRLEDLIADLLDLSRLETPDAPVEMRVVRPAEINESLLSMFEGVCRERSLRLEFEWQSQISALYTDPRLLMLILKNLVENATKFANEGTAIRVSGEPIGAALPPAAGGRAAGSTDETRSLRLRVIDEGVGIPLAHQARIFERFYQVDPSRSGTAQRRGTGLGLAIVKHAVKTLGGSVAVESVWQQGTTMIVELPRCVRV
ncbi:MAG: ATP-binding protein [Planctomycetota bacterium]|nr:ATP-binding protein [Planctomycetota bacterium]